MIHSKHAYTGKTAGPTAPESPLYTHALPSNMNVTTGTLDERASLLRLVQQGWSDPPSISSLHLCNRIGVQNHAGPAMDTLYQSL